MREVTPRSRYYEHEGDLPQIKDCGTRRELQGVADRAHTRPPRLSVEIRQVTDHRAFTSLYNTNTLEFARVGVMTCKWLYQSIHDIHAISNFDYILPLMVIGLLFDELLSLITILQPELFRFTEGVQAVFSRQPMVTDEFTSERQQQSCGTGKQFIGPDVRRNASGGTHQPYA